MAQQENTNTVERLAESVFEVFKDLSRTGQPLSPASLSKAFSSNERILGLMVEDTSSKAGGGVSSRQIRAEQQIQELQAQLRSAREQESKLTTQVSSLETTNSSLKDLSKRCMAVLPLLAKNIENEVLSSSLVQFGSLAVDATALDDHDKYLRKITEIASMEQPGREVGAAGKDEPGEARLETAVRRDGPEPLKSTVVEVRSIFLKLLSALESAVTDEDLRRLHELRDRTKSSFDTGALMGAGNDIVDFIMTFIGHASEEHEQIAGFAREMGKHVLEVESLLLVSVNDTKEAFAADAEFHRSLNWEMSDMEQGVSSFGQNVERAQEFMLAKLKNIKAGLEIKRRQDEVRFQNTCRKMDELQNNLSNMRSEVNQMEERTRTLEKEALVDALTEVHNRRAYELRIRDEIRLFQKVGQRFSIVLLDVDHFKLLNDQYGHNAGDKCLKGIAKRVKRCVRSSDFVARYGGEEFVVILPGAAREDAYNLAEKVRKAIARTRFLYQGQEILVTISLGVAEMRLEDLDPGSLFTRADAAMYTAKREGRNRVSVG